MSSYDEDKIKTILSESRVIAVVGISDKPERDSYRVAKYLKEKGYEILPVNPVIEQWEGIRSYKSLQEIPGDKKVDIIDIFRKSDAVLPIVQEALKIHPRTVWMQEGVVNEEAAELAKKNSLLVVMDRCMMKEHARLNTP
ncbi:MAG: CoA-binding protein [Candidatus Thermoplasmatota archaeon]|nr:CoA-binding protein [Candidatus Thermoplasmatota archaeon]